jgi:lipid II:glycine glycyltransferase (peptidoglycan interpeptide bridge formation enzyme)
LPVFAKEEFLRAVGDEYGWLGGIDESGALRCILPYTVVRKAGVRMVRFRVETIPCGGSLDVTSERCFLNSVVAHFRKTHADVIIPASVNAIFRTYPDGALAAPYGTYFISLAQPEDALWAAVSASHRRHVRSAERSGVQIRSALECMSTAHAIIHNTFRKSSQSFMSFQNFTRMIGGLEVNVHLLVAESHDQVQCCAVIAFSQHAAYYLYGGSIPQAVPGSMHLLHWEAIRLYRRLAVRRYDFCGARIKPSPGSKAAGLAAFKQRFGAELDQGYMWKCHISTLKSAIYSVGVRYLRGGDIVDAEHHKLDHRPVVADSCSPQSNSAKSIA